jgi:ribose 1,5-bisphosphokinase
MSRQRPLGSLVLVVGPSGVGKDTLIGGARAALENDTRFSFVRRIVNRPVDAELEDHESMDPGAFAASEAADRFCLVWSAHNQRYALVGEACQRFPGATVILVTAEISLRAERLIRRGQENRDQVTARLARETAPVPMGISPMIIDNSGPIAIGVTAFVMALRTIAARD